VAVEGVLEGPGIFACLGESGLLSSGFMLD